MFLRSFSKSFIAGGLLLSVFATYNGAQAQQDIQTFVKENAQIAGAARYCGIERDLLEEFIAKTEARIALLANDSYDNILNKIEFKNLIDASSGKEPEAGCQQFDQSFFRALRDLG